MTLENSQAITGSQVLINKFLPVTLLYFFFNSFLLPLGLLYTTLLTPFFLVWLYNTRAFNYVWIFFLVTLPYILVHFINGVELVSYIRSYVLLFSVFVFALSFHHFLRRCKTIPYLFKIILIVNSFLVLIALVVLFIPALQNMFWHVSSITPRSEAFKRLKLLTYEASYYSFLIAPILLYYYLKMLLSDIPNKALIFWLVTIPLLLSLSFGVIATIAGSLLLLLCSDIKLFTFNRRFPLIIVIGLIVFCFCLFLALQFFADNIIFVRIGNIFQGRDTSFSGRTFDSLYLGWKLAEQKSILFGCGPGQIKVVGVGLFREYYNYAFFTPSQLTVPNSLGDTLATFGISGVVIKLSLEIYFFFKTRVYNNFYRLSLFLFIFIYQFTGSYLTNIAEYVIWIMAFYPYLFEEFNKQNVYQKKTEYSNN